MPLPPINALLLDIPLYEKLPISELDAVELKTLILFKGSVDGYCPFCRKPSTLRGKPDIVVQMGSANLTYNDFLNKIHHINLHCTRITSHIFSVSFYFTENLIFKIGQYPSIADLSIPELHKYRKVLGQEKYQELIRGVGLISHGVGIGAFTYLRRVFEYLIEEAHQKLSTNADWDENLYQRSRMEEKILILQTELPKFLVDNRKLYSILSLGIHELNEATCLEYFPTVRLGVELILEEKLKDKIMQEKIRDAQKSISKINTQLSTKDKVAPALPIPPTINSPVKE